MNTKILQKCLDELNKEPFKIDKVIGMLETMIEMSGNEVKVNIDHIRPIISIDSINNDTENIKTEEDAVLERYAKGAIGNIN
jgi:hypothetical protein